MSVALYKLSVVHQMSVKVYLLHGFHRQVRSLKRSTTLSHLCLVQNRSEAL